MTKHRLAAVLTLIAVAALAPVPLAGPARAAAVICNRYCDGRDPALAPSERVPVAATLYGRTFRLHIDDTDAMGWASVSGGTSGDEVWLDRSMDGGRSWPDGSRLGETRIPAGGTGWRTGMVNVDDWATRGVGALRACGRAGDRPEIACTPWARTTWNAGNRRTAASTALMMRFDRATGLFDTTGWWTGANALTALIDSIRVSGMQSYRYAISETYDRNITSRQGQFRNEYLDDTGWWGLAWVAAYDLTGESRYLATARADADHMHAYWDTRCGGGVYWRTDRAAKNAIANSLFIQLNAELSRRIPGDTVYRQRAQAGWAWFQSTGMINAGNLVNDGVDLGTCRNNGDVTWTYNQGVLINALVRLNQLTGDPGTLATARRIGDALTASTYLNANGIMREPNESNTCAGDGVSFKGAAVRGLGVLDAATGGAYRAYLQRQVDSAYARNRDTLDQYGSHWAGPYVATNHSCQHSVLDLLNAVP
ncbi:glycoside hydrolase family 76 protein [Actinoplanes philippinensis]|uniref:glycoside hydrolase family 76 protein n=1 Tax=Actinoplanes philippinensis TaxID=35752 RepID=UPI0033FC9A12